MDQSSPPDAPSTKQSSAESSLQAFFELFAQRERTEQELIRGLVSICTVEPHATWQALSLMDQYHRRGVLATTFYRELKKELNAIAFGNAGTHVSVDGKTFAHAMAGRTAQLAPAGKFEPTDYLTINLATSHAGKPSTRVKTVMLDLDFVEDADADKTLAQSPGSGTLMGGAPKTKNAGAALRKTLAGKAPPAGDATALVTKHGQPDVTETRARVAINQADDAKKLAAAAIATPATKDPVKLSAIVAPAQIDPTQVDPPYIETHHSKPRFHPERVDPTPVDPPRIEPIYVEPTIVEAPRFESNVLESSLVDSNLLESNSVPLSLATPNLVTPDLAVPEWFEADATPNTTIDPIDAATPASNASQIHRSPESLPEYPSARAANASAPKAPLPASTPEPAQIDSAQARATNRVGTVLNERYVLVEPVTSGNISMVFKAFDQQRGSMPELERYVAIKCPHANLQNDPRTLAAFRHEYAQSQTILHPNIAKIYDLYDENSQCFIVMELLSGEPLDRLLERISPRRLPLPRALGIVREIGLALAHAHDHGVVHGNLQASNVTLTGKGEIRVSDFAQSAGWLPPDAPKAQPTDDLYSLACIAHELLCGCYPESKPPEQRPRYAKHLSSQQWRALRNGLAEEQPKGGSSGRLNYIKRWLAELDLRTAEIRLPPLAVLESELAGQRTTKSRTPVTMLGYAGAALGGLVVVAALIVLLRGALTSTPAPAPQGNQAQLNQLGTTANSADGTKDPIAAAWAAAGTAAPDASATASASAPATQNNSVPAAAAIDAAELPTVSFTADRYEVSEQEGVAKLLVQRSEPTNKKLQLRWFTIPGSAQPGIDYVGYQYASLQLQPGQKSAEISIPLIQGAKHDRDVSFDVRISATGEALPGRAVVAKVIVLPAM